MGIERVFIDTNILIYFFEKNDDFFTKVLPIFKEAEKKQLELFTSTISYIEVLVPVLKQNDIALETKYNYVFKKFLTTVDIDLNIAKKGALLKSRYNIKIPDALQIASAIVSKCEKFFTSDKQLAKIQEIEVEIIG